MGPGVERGVAEVPQQMLLPKKLGDPYQKRINRLIYIYAYIPYIVYIVVLTRGLAYAYSWHPCAMYWICSRWGPIWAGFIVSGDGSNLVGGLSHPTKPGGGSSATSMGWPTITNHNGSTIAWWFYDFPSFSHPALWWWLKWWPRMPQPKEIGGETTCNILQRQCCLYSTLRSSKMAMGKSSIPDLVRWFSHRLTLPEGKPDSDYHSCGKPWTLSGSTSCWKEPASKVGHSHVVVEDIHLSVVRFFKLFHFLDPIPPNIAGWWIR